MYLRTPKRYTAKGSKKPLISLRWLWLYLLAPVVIIGAALVWDNRSDWSQAIGEVIGRVKIAPLDAPTATPTRPAADLQVQITQALDGGNLNEALDAMHAYNDSEPNDMQWHALYPELLVLRAYLVDTDLMAQAQQAGQNAINANPEVPEGWISEALVLDWTNQSKQALSYALRAKDLGDANGMTSAVLGGIYRSLGDVKQANTLIDAALKTNPNLVYAYFVKGQLDSDNGDVKAAISMYQQGWQVAGGDHTQWAGYVADALAASYATQNQLDKGLAIIADALQRDKDDPQLYFRQSAIFNKQGDYDKATQSAQNCIDHNANYLECHEQLAVLNYTNKQYGKSANAAQTAFKLGSIKTSVYYYGGLSYISLNRCNDALPLLRTGLDFAQKQNKTSAISDFTKVLSECGDTVGSVPVTESAAVASATPKKR